MEVQLPIIFRWTSLKGGGLNLVELFDQAGHQHWRSPREFGLDFACDYVLSSYFSREYFRFVSW